MRSTQAAKLVRRRGSCLETESFSPETAPPPSFFRLALGKALPPQRLPRGPNLFIDATI